MNKANEWRDQPLSQDEVENEREQRPDRGGVGKQVGGKKKDKERTKYLSWQPIRPAD